VVPGEDKEENADWWIVEGHGEWNMQARAAAIIAVLAVTQGSDWLDSAEGFGADVQLVLVGTRRHVGRRVSLVHNFPILYFIVYIFILLNAVFL